MANPKPIGIELKFGLIIGLVIIATAVVGTFAKWKEFYDLFVPNGTLLNWRFVFLILSIAVLVVWFVMNYFWQQEYNRHEITKKDRDNLNDALKISENERLTDVITGIPNSRSLEKDIDEFFARNRPSKKMQFIFIDLKNFRKVNSKFGFNKTNDLLRAIAQTIYKRMRRNEDMYKYSVNDNHDKESFYRVYPGGDEFAFIIEGDQADAIGFSNRLIGQFQEISKKTINILGENINLSFHCAVVEIDPRDSFNDIFRKAEDCYKISKEGKSEFTICWHPNTQELILSKDPKKKADYERARSLFEVMTIVDKDYE
ncbi:GGDEF domain-containing protein [Pinibacter soli]|uniref:GGDEF domain-containing protein n=1 Tax=Pinibacter soli TaxID=3044211 RepID=A0ABT6REK6_9BACT|nr:GGDEF domain-containing protein [Pinibacter soli]MDI3320965.1 GGDEF domain-containing protein [Pinibacter soli]